MKQVSQIIQIGCQHSATSLVEMDTKENGPFITVQCDVCGACLPGATIDDATFDAWFERRLAVPRMDYAAYCSAVDRVWRSVVAGDTAELAAFVRVARSRGGKA